MRIARIIGNLTLTPRLPELKPGRWLIAETLDAQALEGLDERGVPGARGSEMPESLVVFDELGAGVGQVVAVSEGREACMPWYPERVPIDAYVAAILDNVDLPGGRKK